MHVHPLARASADEDAARVLAENGDIEAARDHLEHSLATYERAGARADAARARRLMVGLDRRRRARPISGWASLTPTEVRVAEAVAEGLTNAEVGQHFFLSRHTVDFHLRQIFRKLAVASRVELTRHVLTRAFENDS
jgi:DNA-binding CsgD family transcriptional regulator